MRILIVGGVAAGMSAASRAVRQDPDAEVVVFERDDVISYGACGLPYVLGGDAGDWDDLVVRTPAQMAERGVEVQLGHEAVDVDAARGTLTVRGPGGGTRAEPYDRLLIATGAAAIRPDWAGRDVHGVHVLKTIDDGRAIAADLSAARRVCVIGVGYIGLELAEAFRTRGRDVTLVGRESQAAEVILDPELCGGVHDELERHGVELHLDTEATGLVVRDGRVRGVDTGDGTLPADLVVVGVGVAPSVALLRAAGARLGDSGAAAVDDRQRTSVEGVYAAGDNCEALHRVTGRPVHIPLGLTANRMGRVAGVNMAGGDARFPGIVGSSILKLFNLGVAGTGLTQAAATDAGLDAVSVDVETGDHASYYRDTRPIHVRLTGERGSGRLLGAQIVAGNHHSALRIDVVAALLHHGTTAADMAEMDLAYAPPFASVWDVLLVAAGKLAEAVR